MIAGTKAPSEELRAIGDGHTVASGQGVIKDTNESSSVRPSSTHPAAPTWAEGAGLAIGPEARERQGNNSASAAEADADAERRESGQQASASGETCRCYIALIMPTAAAQPAMLFQTCGIQATTPAAVTHGVPFPYCRQDQAGCIQLLWQVSAQGSGTLRLAAVGCCPQEAARRP